MLSLTTVLYSIEDTFTVIHILTYILVHVIEIFILLKIAEELRYQSLKVADAAFDCYWYRFPCPKLRKQLIMVIQKAQNSKKFTAGGIITCDLRGLISVRLMNSAILPGIQKILFQIIRSSFSVITLLQKVDRK